MYRVWMIVVSWNWMYAELNLNLKLCICISMYYRIHIYLGLFTQWMSVKKNRVKKWLVIIGLQIKYKTCFEIKRTI